MRLHISHFQGCKEFWDWLVKSLQEHFRWWTSLEVSPSQYTGEGWNGKKDWYQYRSGERYQTVIHKVYQNLSKGNNSLTVMVLLLHYIDQVWHLSAPKISMVKLLSTECTKNYLQAITLKNNDSYGSFSALHRSGLTLNCTKSVHGQ